MAAMLSFASLVVLCLIPATLQIKFYRYTCLKAKPCPNVPTNGLVDDWVLLMTVAPSVDDGFVPWGPTYPACDPNTITGICSNQGFTILSGDDNKDSTGFSYGFNSQLNQWTIERFVTNKLQIPNTDLVGYETFYEEYITVKEDLIFSGGKPIACSNSANITINPMLRRVRWVLLDTDQNQSYRLTMSCENVDGFLYAGYPQITLWVKRSQIEKFKVSECKQLSIYNALSTTLAKQDLSIDKIQWVFPQQDKLCPNEVTYKSFKWDSCKCQISGTLSSFTSPQRDNY